MGKIGCVYYGSIYFLAQCFLLVISPCFCSELSLIDSIGFLYNSGNAEGVGVGFGGGLVAGYGLD